MEDDTPKRQVVCRVCNKLCTYNKTRGLLCWKCKDNLKSQSSFRNVSTPQRCPDCGHKITVVPCVACSGERNRNAKKEAQS